MVPWSKTERAVATAIRPKLAEYLKLARGSHLLLHRAIKAARKSAATPSSVASQVQARLLTQTSNTLRVVEHAALCGYPIQVLALLAEAYESAHAVAYIGQDDARAREWEAHTDLKDTYPPLRERKAAVRATLTAALPHITNSDTLDRLVAGQERLYTLACMAKHSNPRLVANHGIHAAGDTLTIIHGPVATRQSIKQSRFALFHTSRLLVGATVLFVRPMIEPTPALMGSFLRDAQPIVATLAKMTDRNIDHDLDAT